MWLLIMLDSANYKRNLSLWLLAEVVIVKKLLN